MICPQCGYAMSAFDTDCPRCHGKGLAPPAQSTPQPTPNTQPPAPVPQSQPVNVGKIFLIIGGVSCASILAVAVVVIVLLTIAGRKVTNTFNSAVPYVSEAHEEALRASCQSNMKQLALASKKYIYANKEIYPDLSTPDAIKAALSGHTDNPDCFVCPKTMQPYKGNLSLSGVSDSTMNNSALMAMFYEDEAAHMGGRNVGYADGHVKWLKNDSWSAVKQASGIR